MPTNSKRIRQPTPSPPSPDRADWTPAERARLERLIERLIDGDDLSALPPEITVARLVLARLLRQEADPVRLAAAVARLWAVVLRAHRPVRSAAGSEPLPLTELADSVLLALGLGGDAPPSVGATPP
jgi:hypothetical protein